MIAMKRVIPAMREASNAVVHGIASRDAVRAREAAASAGVEKSYGSYEALLADPDIEVVYIALPNHLHIEWCLKAIAAGKHVLCEKPLSMNAREAEPLIACARPRRRADRGSASRSAIIRNGRRCGN